MYENHSQGWTTKLPLLYCEYTPLLTYLCAVYYTFANIKITSQDKFYTLDPFRQDTVSTGRTLQGSRPFDMCGYTN